MARSRLRSAPDLVARQEYAKVEGRKVLVAIVRSSKTLGLEEREEITQPTAAPVEGSGSRRRERNAGS